jgi:cytochrome c-type biogenesis protein
MGRAEIMKRWVVLGAIIIIAIIFGILFFPSMLASKTYDEIPADNFTAIDQNGYELSLSEYKGKVIILHFTNLETPLCNECLEEMKGQIIELEKLVSSYENVTVITINLRKNPSSDSGNSMAEEDFGVNISWHWIEDYSPYPISSLYSDYWSYGGVNSNPTLVLINTNQSIVEVYNVYSLGTGKIDDIQSAESLEKDINKIYEGKWKVFKSPSKNEGLTFLGVFLLGILTSLSPCSIALLVAMISYVGSLQKGTQDSMKKYSIQGFWIGVVFTLGMAFVFFIFGLILTSVSIVIEISTFFYLIAGIILIVLGINVFKPIREIIRRKPPEEKDSKVMEKGQKILTKLSKRSIYLGAFFLGILFSIGWAPCAMSLMMPVFILTLAQKISIISGGLLLFVFGIGHGVPIIPLCAVTSSIRGKLGNKYVTAGRWMQRIFGIIIIIIGIIMAIRFWGINYW